MFFFQGSSYPGTNFQGIWENLTPLSSYGRDYKRGVKPSTNPKKLVVEYGITHDLLGIINKNPKDLLYLRDILSHIKDVVPIVSKIYRGLVLEEEEFFNLKSWLLNICRIREISERTSINHLKALKVDSLTKCLQIISPDNEGPSFYLSDVHSQKLAQLRQNIIVKKRDLQNQISLLKTNVEKQTNVDFNMENKLKVSKFELELVDHLSKCKGIYYYGESYSHIEFMLKLDSIATDLKEAVDQIKVELEQEEYAVRDKLTKGLIAYIPMILNNCRKIGKLDWFLIKAYYAKEVTGIIPTITHEEILEIVGGRHPVLESILAKRNKEVTPVSISIKEGVTVITGANMGGKSVTLKTTGLLIALAQHGLLVPCEHMTFKPRKFLYYSQTDGHSIYNGLSTFGWEIKEIKKVLAHKDKQGLYLIDELARGTNPLEGGALALSIAKYLNRSKSMTVMTTHFEELVNSEFTQLRIIGLSNLSQSKLKRVLKKTKGFEIIEELMDYQLESMTKGGLPKEGVKIAALMGLPSEIIEEAESIMLHEGRITHG